ncbi:Nucleolar protein 12 [Eumeta japonica]|uniref:Nucleolar protein 12 n=1 Tax=Eumeta variegata TaxID=151549 RepID=A0A4C1UT70_EUMVA|nr:Nucleolar protein 12 [Eumeta japonica]
MGKRKNRNQDRKTKINLVFDESKRREFLCGFRKRKLERKKKAQEELQRLLKEEKKRIKKENKETYKKLVLSSRPIPDIEQLLQEEYEDDDVNVKIVELSSDTLQTKNLCIGENKPKEHLDKDKTDTSKRNKIDVTKVIPGMDLEETHESDDSNSEQSENKMAPKTKQEIKKMLKTQATKKIQKSKLFRMKSRLERVKNKKKSQQKSKVKEKNIQRKEKGRRRINKKKH